MEAVSSARANVGVVCSIQELAPGKLRLVLDDVSNASESISGAWSHRVLFTYKDFEAQDIVNLTLSEKELADFGYALLARLATYRKHPARPSGAA